MKKVHDSSDIAIPTDPYEKIQHYKDKLKCTYEFMKV